MPSIRVLFVAVLTAAVVGVAAPSVQAGQRRQMVRAINFVRGWHHRRSLRFSTTLSRGAASWARHLMRREVLAHSARALRRHEGEIIEWHTGARAAVRNTVIAWWNSPEHRTVMLGRGYRSAGAARAVGNFGGRRCTIWVVRFAH